MIVQCRNYLMEKITAAGIRTKIFSTMKDMEQCNEPHMGGVIFGSDAYARNGSRTIFEQDGKRLKRTKLFDRTITLNAIIGEYSYEALAPIVEAFLENLDRGININGNFTGIRITEAEWAEAKDSVLKANVACNIEFVFEGGVYRDTGYTKVSDVDISVAKVNDELSD